MQLHCLAVPGIESMGTPVADGFADGCSVGKRVDLGLSGFWGDKLSWATDAAADTGHTLNKSCVEQTLFSQFHQLAAFFNTVAALDPNF